MDRQHYKGPQWDEIQIPRTVMEETNPVYRKRDAEPHPSEFKEGELKKGKKEFEYVVR